MLFAVQDPVCSDTVHALEDALNKAKQGKIRGLAIVAIGPRYAYTADVTGIALDNPTFTRGALFILATRLEQLALASA